MCTVADVPCQFMPYEVYAWKMQCNYQTYATPTEQPFKTSSHLVLHRVLVCDGKANMDWHNMVWYDQSHSNLT